MLHLLRYMDIASRPRINAERPTILHITGGQTGGPTLRTEENEPDNGQSAYGETYADQKQHKDRGPGFGLTRFRRCFDNDAVLFPHHDWTLDFGC